MKLLDRLVMAAQLAAAAAEALPTPHPAVARLMCLGDSITLGVGGNGYREPLANLLQQHAGPNWGEALLDSSASRCLHCRRCCCRVA